MRTIAVAVCALMMIGKAIAQPDSTEVMMNTYMAKDPGGNASIANISMWPNPAKGRVNIYMNSIRPGDRGQCVVFNSAGISCIVANISNGTNRIYFSSLPEGMYFVNIRLHNNIIFSKKLIVAR